MSQKETGAPRRIRIGGIAAAAALMLGLYAVPAAAQDSTWTDTTKAQSEAQPDTAAYAPPSAAERAVPNQVHVELKSVASSGIQGTAVLAAEDDGETDIEIMLKDAAENSREYDVTLRTGTCDEPGEVVEKIDDTEADGDPEDEGVDLQLAAILSAPHIIHVTQEGGDAAVACGEVGAQ